MATKRKQGQTLSLKGSTKIVTEFFEYSVNSCVLSLSNCMAAPASLLCPGPPRQATLR